MKTKTDLLYDLAKEINAKNYAYAEIILNDWLEQYVKAQLIKDREKLFREIAQQLWEVNESIYSESEDRNYAIGYDDNGIPNLVSLEIYGRTHSELSFSSPEIE